MTTRIDATSEATRLTEMIDKALQARYGWAVKERATYGTKPLPAHVYAALSDLQGHLTEIHRAARLSDTGKLRVLRAVLGRVT